MVCSVSLLSLITSVSNTHPFIGVAFALLYFVFLHIYFLLLVKAITFYNKNGK